MYRKAPNRWCREWIGLFYTTYLDLYTHCKKRLSLLSYIFWLYGLASYLSALGKSTHGLADGPETHDKNDI